MNFFYDAANAEPPVPHEFSSGRRTGVLENLVAGFDSVLAGGQSISKANGEAWAREERDAAIEKISGKPFSEAIGPFRAPALIAGVEDGAFKNSARIDDLAADLWLQSIPERQREGIVPSAMLKTRGMEIANERLADAASIAARRRGGWEAAAGLGGEAAGYMTDPANIAGLAFGAPLAAGILRTALIEGGIAAVTQAGVEVINDPYRRELGQPAGLDRALGNIALTGAGGAVLGGGVKGLWRLFGRGEGQAGGKLLTTDQMAAFDQVQAFDDLMHANPFDDVPAGRGEHMRRGQLADEALMNDNALADFRQGLMGSTALPERAGADAAPFDVGRYLPAGDDLAADALPERSVIAALAGNGEARRFASETEALAAADRAAKRSGLDLQPVAHDDGTFGLVRETAVKPMTRPDGTPLTFDTERAAKRFVETSAVTQGRDLAVVPTGGAGARRYTIVEGASAADLQAMRTAPELTRFARGEDNSAMTSRASAAALERGDNLQALADAVRGLEHEGRNGRWADSFAAGLEAAGRSVRRGENPDAAMARFFEPLDAPAVGAVRPASDIAAYVRDVAEPSGGRLRGERFLFDMGQLSDDVAAAARRLKPEWSDVPQAVRLPNQVVDKLYRHHPRHARELLDNLPELLARPAEILPDHVRSDRVLFTRPMDGGHGVSVLEAARKRDGIEIVSLHKAPDRTLRKARILLEKESGDGAGGAAVPSSGGPLSRATPAGADFPSVNAVSRNIGPDDGGIKAVADFARAGLRHDVEAGLARFDRPGGEGVQSQTRQLATDLSREIARDGDFDVPRGFNPDGETVATAKASEVLKDALDDKSFLDVLKGCLR